MKIYLAARYSRRLELCDYRRQLEAMGHQVTSRWLNGDHQVSDDGQPLRDSGEALVEGDSGGNSERAAQLRSHFAMEDITDVTRAELVIAFTEPPRSSASRGGRHVELGIALGRAIPVIVVGYRENIFCWLPQVTFFPTWDAVASSLAARCDGCELDAAVEDGLCGECRAVQRGLARTARTPPELGATHHDGGHPEHVPSVYEDGRA